jgi:DNA-binding CsgD family transcriptional regulator
MNSLIPHLRRAVEIKDRLALASLSGAQLLGALDQLPFGMLFLADDGRVLNGSTSALDLVRKREGLLLKDSRLGCVRSVDERALMQRLQEDPLQTRRQDAIPIFRGANRLPLSLLPFPIQRPPETWLAPRCRWTLLVFDPERTPAHPAEALARMLGITRSEAALVERLALGESLKEASLRLNISVHTARTHLKSVFSKTGFSSQLQLIRHVLMTPVLRYCTG